MEKWVLLMEEVDSLRRDSRFCLRLKKGVQKGSSKMRCCAIEPLGGATMREALVNNQNSSRRLWMLSRKETINWERKGQYMLVVYQLILGAVFGIWMMCFADALSPDKAVVSDY
ncbi:hypothetical protein GOP47_0020061 [Adiantum capillus-veneris]|uniref:Uncharacterized protein n=1 Tax=Adiantum capillus-veneris TaxID=13818 RepID=A0A9D4ZA87_ADICA|nr:hypothetical protein GOP47_0020061 [Adiantum capillus-veneris]